jgi:hypothetical protein
MSAKFGYCLGRVGGLRDQFHVGLGGNDGGEALTKYWVILDAQDADSPWFIHTVIPNACAALYSVRNFRDASFAPTG